MDAKEMYRWVGNPANLAGLKWRKHPQGDDMTVIEVLIDDYWKPIYLVDNRHHRAVMFMSLNEYLLTVVDEDIDWSTIHRRIRGYDIAKNKGACFPTQFRGFKNGVGLLEWQVNPDGRYWVDEDGYGMTSDDEVMLYGFIGRDGSVMEPFRYLIGDCDEELDRMRERAEAAWKKKFYGR